MYQNLSCTGASPINEAKGKSKKKRKEVRIKETNFPFENFLQKSIWQGMPRKK